MLFRLSALTLLLGCLPVHCAAALPQDTESTAPLDFKFAFPSNPIRLPQLLSNGAVLQRGIKVPVWGWGEYTHTVTIRIADAVATATVGTQNLWATTIGPLKAGGPYDLVVTDGYTTVISHDVLVGDVWICGGQSSMVQTLAGVANAQGEIRAANYPRLHLLQVPRTTAFSPQNDLPPGTLWKHCTPDNTRSFSAIAYFFGRGISQQQNVPVGIIEASWVNTTIPLWMSEAACSDFGDYEWWQNMLRRTSTPPGRARLDDRQRAIDWIRSLKDNSRGTTGTEHWFEADMRLDRDWKTMRLPGVWELGPLPNFDGIVWFRRNIQVPVSWLGTTPTLHLGHIYDHAGIWFNGVYIGRSDDWATTLSLPVPRNVLRTGQNSIAVRVLDTEAYGGVHGTTNSLSLETTTTEGYTSIPLPGNWRYRIALDLKNAKRPWSSTEQWPHPSAMYNGMIAQLVNHAIRGVVWYQGEADEYQGFRYRELLAAMIRDWRARWKQKQMPFVIAQIASIGPHAIEPEESPWAAVRESQSFVDKTVPAVALTPMYDLGGTTEPHYIRKREAADRLVAAARAVAYRDRSVVYHGPRYISGSLKVRDRKARVTFEPTTGGLAVRGDTIKDFQIAGVDRKFFWADAKLVGTNTIELRSERVAKPVAVRFAWQQHPWATLYNSEGFPAEPFRTDNWPLKPPAR